MRLSIPNFRLIHESLHSLGRLVKADVRNGKTKDTSCILYEIFLCAAISTVGYGSDVIV